MRSVRQYFSLIGLHLGTLGQRPGSTITLVFGIACAVAGLVSMLAIAEGARRQEMSAVRPDRVILMSLGAPDATQSSISLDVAPKLYNLPGVRNASNGQPVAVSEVLVSAEARTRDAGTLMPFRLIGATEALTVVLPELHLVTGRLFRSGLNELISTEACDRLFSGFGVGDTRIIGGTRWQVVGSFELGGSDPGCMAYADASAVMSAYRRDSYNQIVIMLSSPGEYSNLADTLKAMPALRIDARPEREVIREQYARVNGILDFAAYFVGSIMAIGATLGAANSMYAIVDSRRRELATLRALGFGSGPILLATLTGTTILGIPGALLGAAAAAGVFNNLAASPFGLTLRLAVTPGLCLIGIGFAMVIGTIAGLLPGLRAARLPVSVALSRA